MPTDVNIEPGDSRPAPLAKGPPGVLPTSDVPVFTRGEPAAPVLRGLISRINSGEINPARPGQRPGAGIFVPSIPTPPAIISSPKVPPATGNTKVGGALAKLVPFELVNLGVRVAGGERFPVLNDVLCKELTGIDRIKCLLLGAAVLFTRIPKLPVRFVPRTPLRLPPGRLPSRVRPTQKPVRPDVKPSRRIKPTPKPLRRDKPFVRPGRITRPSVPNRPGGPPGLPSIPKAPPASSPEISKEIFEILENSDENLTTASRAVLENSEKVSAKSKVSQQTRKQTGRSSRVGTITGPELGSLLPGFLARSGFASLVGASFSTAPATSPATLTAPSLASAATATPVLVGTAPAPTVFGTKPPSSRRSRDCQEVKRRRRRKGKCREGFFEEYPGSTRFIKWRVVDCRTRKTIEEFS